MNKTFLSDHGNILVPAKRPYFITPTLEFLREVSLAEANYLMEVCIQIDLHVDLPPIEYPTWKFITTTKEWSDYSRYKPETSCNGGDYAFFVWRDWFVSNTPTGWKFAFIERYSTSSEFPYDELAGQFQSPLGRLTITNANDISYETQINEWVDGERCYEQDEILEKLCVLCEFKHLWQSTTDDGGTVSASLSMTDKKNIILQLREVGMSRPIVSRRVHHKSNRR